MATSSVMGTTTIATASSPATTKYYIHVFRKSTKKYNRYELNVTTDRNGKSTVTYPGMLASNNKTIPSSTSSTSSTSTSSTPHLKGKGKETSTPTMAPATGASTSSASGSGSTSKPRSGTTSHQPSTAPSTLPSAEWTTDHPTGKKYSYALDMPEPKQAEREKQAFITMRDAMVDEGGKPCGWGTQADLRRLTKEFEVRQKAEKEAKAAAAEEDGKMVGKKRAGIFGKMTLGRLLFVRKEKALGRH